MKILKYKIENKGENHYKLPRAAVPLCVNEQGYPGGDDYGVYVWFLVPEGVNTHKHVIFCSNTGDDVPAYTTFEYISTMFSTSERVQHFFYVGNYAI